MDTLTLKSETEWTLIASPLLIKEGNESIQ